MRIPKTLRNILIPVMLGLSSLFSVGANAQTFYPALNSKINVFKQPDQSKPLVWDTLSTRNETQNIRNEYFIDDNTDAIQPRTDFVSGDFAMQSHINFHGLSGFPGNVPVKYSSANAGKFNVPLYIVDRTNTDNGLGHGIVGVFERNNPEKGDISRENVLDFWDWTFIEPQTDDVIQPGTSVSGGLVPIPLNSKIEIKQVYWFGTNNYTAQPFLKFFLKNGEVDSVWYDSKLVLSRNQPTAGQFTSPAQGDTIPSGLEKLCVRFVPSTDEDGDSVKHYIRIPQLNSTYSTSADSIEIDRSALQPGTEYDLQGWSVSKGDSVSFSNSPMQFYTPSTTSVERLEEIASDYSVSQNFPNPFNPKTKIRYAIPENTDVSLKVYDMLGREIKTLVDGNQEAGKYDVDFDASSLPSGVYVYRLKAGDFVQSKKMVVGK